MKDNEKSLENHFCKAKNQVAEVRRDFMPLYAAIFNGRLPSGTQLRELLESFIVREGTMDLKNSKDARNKRKKLRIHDQ